MGPQLSWLERSTDNREVPGSSPGGPTIHILLDLKEFRYKYLKRVFIFDFTESNVILQFTVKVFIFSKKKNKKYNFYNTI